MKTNLSNLMNLVSEYERNLNILDSKLRKHIFKVTLLSKFLVIKLVLDLFGVLVVTVSIWETLVTCSITLRASTFFHIDIIIREMGSTY